MIQDNYDKLTYNKNEVLHIEHIENFLKEY